MGFETSFTGVAEIAAVNLTRSGSAEDKVLGAAIKVVGYVDHTELRPVVGAENDHSLAVALWDELGDPRLLGVTKVIAGIAEYKGCNVTFGRILVTDAKVNKFEFIPKSGHSAELTCTVHVADPADSLINLLTSAFASGESVRVEIQEPQQDMFNSPSERSAEPGTAGGEDDPLYPRAVAIVTSTRKAAISHLQRQLQIGYNRAARLVETMEGAGVVSAPDGRGAREVLAAPTGAVH